MVQINILQQRRWAYVDCNFPVSPGGQPPYGGFNNPYAPQNSRPVCKKMKQLSKYLN